MKPTKKEIEILKYGTFMQKISISIDYYMVNDYEWLDEADKILKLKT